jgi:hypothetical protein
VAAQRGHNIHIRGTACIRQRLATGAWRDFHENKIARLPYVDPSTEYARTNVGTPRHLQAPDARWRAEKQSAVAHPALGPQPPLGSQMGWRGPGPGPTPRPSRTHPRTHPRARRDTRKMYCRFSMSLRGMVVGTLHMWVPVSEAPRPVHEARGARVQAHDSQIPSMRCRAVEEQRRFRLCRPVR